MAKAFDSVNRHLLLFTLIKNNLSNKFINIIKFMYNENLACVKTNQGYTQNCPIHTGTKQGCNLSPNLFNIFLNDLPTYLKKNKAGNITLYDRTIHCLMYDIVIPKMDCRNHYLYLNTFAGDGN